MEGVAMMARGGCNFEELMAFQQKMEQLADNMNHILDICAKDLAQSFLKKVVPRTPVGVYSGGKQGGTLRRGWSLQNVRFYHSASACLIEITNPVEYANYVEYGHRTANHTGWVPGKFMMTVSTREIQRDTPGILEKKIKKMMEAQLR